MRNLEQRAQDLVAAINGLTFDDVNGNAGYVRKITPLIRSALRDAIRATRSERATYIESHEEVDPKRLEQIRNWCQDAGDDDPGWSYAAELLAEVDRLRDLVAVNIHKHSWKAESDFRAMLRELRESSHPVRKEEIKVEAMGWRDRMDNASDDCDFSALRPLVNEVLKLTS